MQLGLVVGTATAVVKHRSLEGRKLLLVQLLAYVVVRMVIPNINQDIPDGKIAPATYLAMLSLATGILNSACMTY